MLSSSGDRWWMRRLYVVVLTLVVIWAVGNCVYVYGVLNGAKSYRVETTAFVLMAALFPLAVLPPSDQSARAEPGTRGVLIIAACAVAGWASLFVFLLRYPFLSDDYVFLDLYQHPATITQSPQFFRPLFGLVFWIFRTTFPYNAIPFHTLSMALHAGAAWMLYALGRRLFHDRGRAVVAASLFLINPLQLEATLWISGLQDVMWSFFVLTALVCYLGTQRLSVARLVATSALIALGLLSKETAVCYVLLLPAADWIVFRLERGRLLRAAYVCFSIEAIVYLLVRSRFKPMETTYFIAPSRYFLKQFVTTPYKYFVFPWNDAAVHIGGFVMAVTAMAVIGAIVYTTWCRRRASRVPAGAFVVLATTVPVYSYFYVGSDLMASRYIYCAAAGWAIIVAELVRTTVRREALFAWSAVAIIGASTWLLHLNARPWLVAQTVMRSIQGASAQPGGVDSALATWRNTDLQGMTWRRGVPYTYKGVGIFINGYAEFLRMSERDRPAW